jgi:hypothetical protein
VYEERTMKEKRKMYEHVWKEGKEYEIEHISDVEGCREVGDKKQELIKPSEKKEYRGYLVIPPYVWCEIRWASKENSFTLDNKVEYSGPVCIAVIGD